MNKTWLDNPFWLNPDKTQLKAIMKIEGDDGVHTTQVMTVPQLDKDGNPNPDFDDIISQVGEEKINNNTDERENRHRKEKEAKRLREADHDKSKKLETLFEAKLEAFEIPEIKNSKNRELKTSLRRSKSIVEVNIYSMMIVMEYIENEKTEK